MRRDPTLCTLLVCNDAAIVWLSCVVGLPDWGAYPDGETNVGDTSPAVYCCMGGTRRTVIAIVRTVLSVRHRCTSNLAVCSQRRHRSRSVSAPLLPRSHGHYCVAAALCTGVTLVPYSDSDSSRALASNAGHQRGTGRTSRHDYDSSTSVHCLGDAPASALPSFAYDDPYAVQAGIVPPDMSTRLVSSRPEFHWIRRVCCNPTARVRYRSPTQCRR